jgi:hypothetical protein
MENKKKQGKNVKRKGRKMEGKKEMKKIQL